MRLAVAICIAITILQGCAAPRQLPPPQPHPTPVAEKAVDTRMLIIIDAGHGGDDRGTKAASNSPQHDEKALTLATAKMVEKALNTMGYRTLLTRHGDTFVSLNGRTKIANARRATLFVSIHFNSAPSKEAHGVEIFYYRSDNDRSRCRLSKQCAEEVLKTITQETGARSRGVKHGNFAVIRETEMPAILIEGGFVTNKAEFEKIRNPAYRQKLAEGIAIGIQHYLSPK